MLSAAFDDHSPSGGDIVTGLSVAAGRFASANGDYWAPRTWGLRSFSDPATKSATAGCAGALPGHLHPL